MSVDVETASKGWKDQFTKLMIWNITQFDKVLNLDPDITPIKSLAPVFDTSLNMDEDGKGYLFAAVYDSGGVRDGGRYSKSVPELGPEDKMGHDEFNAGMFLLHSSQKQAVYIEEIYENPAKGLDFIAFMEQSLLRYLPRGTPSTLQTQCASKFSISTARCQS